VRVVALDAAGQPVVGAKVFFTGAGGQNLAVGNTLADSVRLSPGSATDGRNWQAVETTIHHDDADVWLSYNWSGTGPNNAQAGDEYWWMGERLRLVEQLAVDGSWQQWRTARGLTNTTKGWLVAGISNTHFLRAPAYHTTDAAGEVWNVTCLLVGKSAANAPSYTGWFLSAPANVLAFTWYAPVTVRVEADGYDVWEASYPREVLESVGVKPFVVVAQLTPTTPPPIILQASGACALPGYEAVFTVTNSGPAMSAPVAWRLYADDALAESGTVQLDEDEAAELRFAGIAGTLQLEVEQAEAGLDVARATVSGCIPPILVEQQMSVSVAEGEVISANIGEEALSVDVEE